jgi:uncharacterized protein (TIGR02328 family)
MSCCNLRGLGWGKRNKNINYIYDDSLGEEALAAYHQLVLKEMERREYNFERRWLELNYCGKRRQARQVNYRAYKEVLWRNIPLQGHTLEFYLNDVQALQERGLDVKVQKYVYVDDFGVYMIYTASRGDVEVLYGIRIGGTKDEQ